MQKAVQEKLKESEVVEDEDVDEVLVDPELLKDVWFDLGKGSK
jgi:hypothetical protein